MAASEDEHVTYLANILDIARADGTLSPRETSAIEEVRTSIGANKSAVGAATRAVETGSYVPAHVRAFPMRVSNIGDMLFVSLVDGDLAGKELTVVRQFARSAPLSEEQFDILMREAVARAEAGSRQLVCPNCSATAGGTAKFCPSCGKHLMGPERDAVAVTLQVPSSGYAIEFSESSAAGFEGALRLARLAPAFSSCVRNKKTWYLAAWPTERFADVARLAESLAGMRNRCCYQDGAEVAWDEVFHFLWCARNRHSAYKPVLYCFGRDENRVNPWGCKNAQLEWTEWANWFSYGEWRRSGLLKTSYIWRFDKERIRHDVLTNLHKFRHCPHLRNRLVEAVLSALPDEVEVSEKGPWKYSRGDEQTPGSVNVVEVERSADFSFKTEYWADGVRPRGLGILEEVLKRAFAEAGVGDVKAWDLVK